MSSCTSGVAVAVRAMTGAGRSSGQPLAEHAVVRPEVVAPLRDAVRLVDGDQGGRALGEHLGEAGHAQPLGRDEEEVEAPVEVLAARAARGGAVATGVDALGGEALRDELADLVLHQRDERAHHQGGSARATPGS